LIIHIKNILLAVLVITRSSLANHCWANADAASSTIAFSKMMALILAAAAC